MTHEWSNLFRPGGDGGAGARGQSRAPVHPHRRSTSDKHTEAPSKKEPDGDSRGGLGRRWHRGLPRDRFPGGAEAAAARAVVVATNGSDDGAGTAADPYATLEKAFDIAKAGTTIQVKGGTYYPRKSLKSQENGTAREPITLKPYGTDRVKVDGSKLPEGQWIVGLGGDHWHVSDMRFRNGPAHGFVATSSTGGVFENLTTEGNGDSGFTLRGEGTVNNLVKNLDSYGNYDPANHGQNADGLAVKFGSGKGNKVTGARLFNNSDDGADLWKFGTGLTIEHSWAYGNGKNRWNDGAFEGNGNGFKLGGDGTAMRPRGGLQRRLGQPPARLHREQQPRRDAAEP